MLTIPSSSVPETVKTDQPMLWGSPPCKLEARDTEALRTVTALNEGLTRAHTTGNPICWILARIRCEVFRCTPTAYETLVGDALGRWAYGSERPPSSARPRFESEQFTKLFKKWRTLVSGSDSDRADLVEAAIDRIIDAMTVRKEYRAAFQLYLRWRIEVGAEEFEKLSGLKYNSLWSRNDMFGETSIAEMVRVGIAIGVIPAGLVGVTLREHPRVLAVRRAWMSEGIERERLAPMVEAAGLLQLAGYAQTSEVYQAKPFSFPGRVARAFARYESVPWESVKVVGDVLVEAGLLGKGELGEFSRLWDEAVKQDGLPHHQRLKQLADERGFSNAAIAEALGLYDGSVSKKAPNAVFHALSYGDYSSSVPPSRIAVVVARDLREFDALVDGARAEAVRIEKRAGRPNADTTRIERYVWGVTEETRDAQPEGIAERVRAIRGAGLERLRSALAWIIRLRCPWSVSEVYAAQIALLGGLAPVVRKIGGSQGSVEAQACGREVPSLPEFLADLEALGVERTNELDVSWGHQYASSLVARGQSDLERALNTFFARSAKTRTQYLAANEIAKGSVQDTLQIIQAVGVVDQDTLTELLKLLKVDHSSGPGLFLSLVNRTGSIDAAIAEFAREQGFDIRGLRAAARAWVAAAADAPIEDLMARRFPPSDAEKRPVFVERFLQMPGATLVEVGGGATGSVAEVQRILASQAGELGLSATELAVVLHAATQGCVATPALVAAALGSKIVARVTAPGTLCALAASSPARYGEFCGLATAAVHQRLTAFGLTLAPLAVTLNRDGIRQDDLGKLQKDFGILLTAHDDTTQASEEAKVDVVNKEQERIQALGQATLDSCNTMQLGRNVAALNMAAQLQFAYHPQHVSKLCDVVVSASGDKAAFYDATQITFNDLRGFCAGEAFPSLVTLKVMCAASSIPWRPEYEIGWQLAFTVDTEEPLARALLVIFASDPNTVAKLPRDRNRLKQLTPDRLVDAFSAAHAIDATELRRCYRKALSGDVGPACAMYVRIPEVAGDRATSSRPRFLQALADKRSPDKAFAEWWRTFGGSEIILREARATRRYVDVPALPTGTAQATTHDELILWRGAVANCRRGVNVADVLAFTARLPGITGKTLKACLDRHLVSNTAPKLTAPDDGGVNAANESVRHLPAAITYTFLAEDFRLPSNEKLWLLAKLQSEGVPVSREMILKLMPVLAARMKDAESRWRPELVPALICACGFFRDPLMIFSGLCRAPILRFTGADQLFATFKVKAEEQNPDNPVGGLEYADLVKLRG